MPMMSLAPILQTPALAPPEVYSIAVLAGLMVTGSFGLVYYVLNTAAKERERDREVRKVEAEATAATVHALSAAMEAMRGRG